MKKALAIIGSSQGNNSCTAQFARLIFEKAQEYCNEPFEYEIITMNMVRIDYCRGCCNCFRNCSCPLDETDDMHVLKQKLLNSDFFLFGSPVYAHQISGAMKTVIDRLSYWLHLLPLAGKAGIALSTTAATGEMEVLNYLVKIMYPLGLKPAELTMRMYISKDASVRRTIWKGEWKKPLPLPPAISPAQRK